ncbi:MAG: NAD(P)/FAD-dependent oxidoreductase [archaeon]
MPQVTIIGGSVVGLFTAIKLKEKGVNVTVVEEHEKIGVPERCAGLLSKSGCKSIGLNVKDCLVNEVKGAKIFSPDNTLIKVEKSSSVAFVVNRKKLDLQLYEQAKEIGVDFRLGRKLFDKRGNTVFLTHNNRGEMLKTEVLIGCDGPTSKTRKLMGLTTTQNDFVQGFQARVEGNFDSKFVEMHYGSFAPNFFAWVIPESTEIARIGLGCKLGVNPIKRFEWFANKLGLKGKTLSSFNALIPLREPLNSAVKDNCLLLGDSAFNTKATTGGGIITGCTAGMIAADTIAKNLKGKGKLNDFQKNSKQLTKELKIHFKIHSFLKNLKEEEIDNFFTKAKNAGIEEFLSKEGDMDYPTTYLKKLLFKPRLWSLLPTALKFT